ncbi:hypothetical protein SORBI_3003G431200 [Sorghum bicolor]|uniref:Serine protease n=3 Tax=Sorghum bicolor TaxID=4558 RepID=A0A1W0W1F5_SORBI|nr:hypothetical protein SORBI_3003G431200 [Sorghum bicolor]
MLLFLYLMFFCVLSLPSAPTGLMEAGELLRSVSVEVAPSVVVVEQVHRLDYFCTGSVVRSVPNDGTFILAQAEILDTYSDVRLRVHFSDGLQATAQVVLTRGQFCILRTEYNPRCKVIELDTKATDLGYMMIRAPFSRSTHFPVPTFLFQSRLICTTFGDHAPTIRGSCEYFMVVCQYGDTSANGVSRLVAGPVFSMAGKVVGILVRDNSDWVDKSDPGEDPRWVAEGFQFKTCMSAQKFKNILWSLFGECGWRKGRKRASDERRKSLMRADKAKSKKRKTST